MEWKRMLIKLHILFGGMLLSCELYQVAVSWGMCQIVLGIYEAASRKMVIHSLLLCRSECRCNK